MTLPGQKDTRSWVGRTVVDRHGADIGVCAALLADTTTGQPEWIQVERDEVILIVPLLDAEQSGGRVHVTVTRAYADGAPRFGPTQELTRDQEAALYRHYGIEYSAETSDSLLPAGVEPTDPENAGSATAPAAGQHVASGGGRRGGAVAAAVAALVGLTAAVVAAVRLRRRTPPPTPAARRVLAVRTAARARALQVAAAAGPVVEASGRLARSGGSAGAASARRAAVDAARRTRAATTAARTWTDVTAARLAPLLATTGQAAWRGVRAGTDSALRITDAATEAVVAAVPRVTAGTARLGRTGLRAVLTVGAAAEAVPEVVAETGEALEKGWKKAMRRLSLGLGLGIGYVLGARAGRARFEQIKQAAVGYLGRPEVQHALAKARAAAPAPLQSGIDRVSARRSGRAGDSARTTAPQQDPLIPPATTGNDPSARPSTASP